uniref:Glyoxalase domain containing 4 n=1 Tax=Salmo trutta TaxID=8032 RepID=A0A674ACD2_SALTR
MIIPHRVFFLKVLFLCCFFYVLCMTILRHKELQEGCKATCKGPYDGKWSKTTFGFGPEDDDFVAELIYNYRVGEYRLGNNFLGLPLESSQAVSNAKLLGWPLTGVGKGLYLAEAPGGYRFYLVDKEQPPNDPVQKVCLAVSDLHKSIHCCSSLLGTKVKEGNEEKKTVLMLFAETQCKLELHNIVGTVDHGTAFGQIAFSFPCEQLTDLEALMMKGNHKTLTLLVSLDSPGKATVQVVIWTDSDAHEISLLSYWDPNVLTRIVKQGTFDKWGHFTSAPKENMYTQKQKGK